MRVFPTALFGYHLKENELNVSLFFVSKEYGLSTIQATGIVALLLSHYIYYIALYCIRYYYSDYNLQVFYRCK